MKRGFLAEPSSKPRSPNAENGAALPSTKVTHESSRDNEAAADPDDYPKMVTKLQCTNYDMMGPDGRPHACEFHIIGTAHVSKESCRDVEKVIRRVQPDVVMLELCSGRKSLLAPQTKARVPTMAEMLEDLKSGKTPLFGIVYSWMLAKFAAHLEVMPGEEFRVGFMEAQAIGAKVVLGDRHVNTTLKRTWAALSTWQRIKFIWCLIYSGIAVPDAEELEQLLNDLKETDMLTEAIKELSKEFPSLAEPLIYERDRYMVHCLRSLGKRGAERVVAVVGAGHMPGMRENWEKEIDMEEITRIPEAPPKPTYVSWSTLFLLTSASSAAAVMYLRSRRR